MHQNKPQRNRALTIFSFAIIALLILSMVLTALR
jgi:predicted nucleic acid-binding Zn ribbon protein